MAICVCLQVYEVSFTMSKVVCCPSTLSLMIVSCVVVSCSEAGDIVLYQVVIDTFKLTHLKFQMCLTLLTAVLHFQQEMMLLTALSISTAHLNGAVHKH